MTDRVSIVEGSSELVAEFASLTDELASHRSGRRTAADVAAWLADAHPQRRRSRLRLLLAPGRARVAAIVNPRLADDAGRPIGLLGFFESHDDPAAARAVLHAGAAWLRAEGCATVRGPVDYSTWNDYRFVVERREPGWFPGEPDHPAYYPELWTGAGFAIATRYASHWLGDLAAVCARFAPKIARGRASGVEVRPVTAADLPALYHLAVEGFRGAYMYAPIDPEEFAALYSAGRAAEVAATSFVAVAEGRHLGFVYTYVADLPSGPAGIVKTIVVDPAARDRGVYHGLLAAALEAFLARGVPRALGALMHSEGDPALMGWCKPDTMFAQYALYEAPA